MAKGLQMSIYFDSEICYAIQKKCEQFSISPQDYIRLLTKADIEKKDEKQLEAMQEKLETKLKMSELITNKLGQIEAIVMGKGKEASIKPSKNFVKIFIKKIFK